MDEHMIAAAGKYRLVERWVSVPSKRQYWIQVVHQINGGWIDVHGPMVQYPAAMRRFWERVEFAQNFTKAEQPFASKTKGVDRMNTFRDGPFPSCQQHDRPLMRVALSDVPDPAQATEFALSCPDCAEQRLRTGYWWLGTPDIPISRAEFDALPSAPKPFGLAPDGSHIEL